MPAALDQTPNGLGPIYTTGSSFRARAEARQREYRARTLRVGHGDWGHWLGGEAMIAGKNFVVEQAFGAVQARMARGKGVDAKRTFENMLSSQAMCFNLFTPLAADTALAGRVLRRLGIDMAVRSISFEHTPEKEIFNDQSAKGGVDCDLLIVGEDASGATVVMTIETKFVEDEFSICGFRKAGRANKGRQVCPTDIVLDGQCGNCLYSASKKYRYWQRSWEVGNLRRESLPTRGCAFAGPMWQLWVNHTLACVEAKRRDAARAIFGVCAPKGNEALLDDGVLEQFSRHLAAPSSFVFIDLDRLIDAVSDEAKGRSPWHDQWCQGLADRYGRI